MAWEWGYTAGRHAPFPVVIWSTLYCSPSAVQRLFLSGRSRKQEQLKEQT